jgi:hypothetical protein
LLRWTYGPLLGVIAARRWPRSARSVASGLVIGSAVFGFELVALPGAGLTPPLRRWAASDFVLLALHTAAFGLAAAVARELLDRSRTAASENATQ